MRGLFMGNKTGAAFAVVVFLAFCAGCNDDTLKEVKELRGEVAQLKTEVRDLRRRVELRTSGKMESRFMREDERAMHRQMNGTNGVRRVRSDRFRPSREELESRRKMMQDPEMRKKFQSEHKARMEERRRQHEERRHEMEERRRNGKVTNPQSLDDTVGGTDANKLN